MREHEGSAIVESGGWAEAERVFRAQIAPQRLHPGAALAVYHRGHPVLDLVGGFADPQRGDLVRSDTPFQLRSEGKPLASVAMLQLFERGQIELDTPAARYWPEFGRHGKDAVTIRHLLTHRGGFADNLGTLHWHGWSDPEAVSRALEDLPLVFAPGSAVSYYDVAQQWVCAELVRRVDGRSFSDYLRDEITGPLQMNDTHVGLPPELERRVARCHLTEEADEGDFGTLRFLNRTEAHQLPAPAFGVAAAHDIARFYAALVAGGALDGTRILKPETVALALSVAVDGEWDRKLGGPVRRGLGFNLGGMYEPHARVEGSASSERTFYHGGAGTILGCGDLDLELGMAFMCNGFRAGRREYRDKEQTIVDVRADDTGITRFREICDAVRAACA